MKDRQNPALDPRFLAISDKTGCAPIFVTGVAWAVAEWAGHNWACESDDAFDFKTYAKFSGLRAAKVKAIYEAMDEVCGIGPEFPRLALPMQVKIEVMNAPGHISDTPDTMYWYFSATDPRLTAIAKRLGQLPVVVAGLWWALTQYAHFAEPGNWQIEEYEYFSWVDEDEIDAIFMAFEDEGMVRWSGSTAEYYRVMREERAANENVVAAASAA